jgi:inner membrane protein
MIAAAIADLDGIGIFFGQKYYWEYHHKLGHNLFFGLLSSLLLAAFANQRLKTFILCLLLFHLHLVMDYFGSGPGWHIHYLWPLGNLILINPHAWEFYSWQNLLAFLLLFLWTLWIARQQGRTPIETITPRLDREMVAALRRFTRYSLP